jgi:hypothetical protein
MPSTPDFKERLNKITLRNTKVKHRPNTNWPMEKKIEVVSQFLVLGNMKMVAAMTGVSYDLIRQWKLQPWWKELEAEIRQTQNIEMDTKLSKIVDKSLDATLDRIENGEFFYDQKTGQVKRKPAALRDVARVSVDMLSKRELLRGNATERKETTQISVAEQLKLLAAEFAKWQEKPKEVLDVEMVEVLDVEIKDALHEEREEGLQAGGSEVYLEAGSSEEEGSAECSPEGDGEGGESPQR